MEPYCLSKGFLWETMEFFHFLFWYPVVLKHHYFICYCGGSRLVQTQFLCMLKKCLKHVPAWYVNEISISSTFAVWEYPLPKAMRSLRPRGRLVLKHFRLKILCSRPEYKADRKCVVYFVIDAKDSGDLNSKFIQRNFWYKISNPSDFKFAVKNRPKDA